jgi:hypothetical protein
VSQVTSPGTLHTPPTLLAPSVRSPLGRSQKDRPCLDPKRCQAVAGGVAQLSHAVSGSREEFSKSDEELKSFL